MFAKPAHFALAAVALTLASGAFAESAQRNVFDTETDLRVPAASTTGLTREAVQGEYIAKRDAKGISEFNPHAWYFAQNADSAPALVALFSNKAEKTRSASATGLSRDEVRSEVIAARASGQLNPFDTETDQRIPQNLRNPAPTALAQR